MRLEYRSCSPRDKWVLFDDRGNVIIMAESRGTCLSYAVTKGYDITKLEKVWQL